MNKKLGWFGGVITVLYVSGFILFVICKNAGLPNALNEWGDFLGGVFGPLAFLWLVLGFFQQGEELKQNTKALKLQADELKNSVEQQRSLVEETKKQVATTQAVFEEEKKRQLKEREPDFKISYAGYYSANPSQFDLSFSIINLGCTATNVHWYFLNREEEVQITPVWERGQEKRLSILIDYDAFDSLEEGEIELSLTYINADDNKSGQVFSIQKPDKKKAREEDQVIKINATKKINS